MAKTFACLILLLISPAVSAVTQIVGDNNGWTTGINYDQWAAARTFAVGDTLLFNFDPNSHAVDEVTQANYQLCNTANPISSSTISPTTVALSAPGTRYFISPRNNDCLQGMKLTVTVGGFPGQFAPPPPPPFGVLPSPFGFPGQFAPPPPFFFRAPPPPFFYSSATSLRSDWRNIFMAGSSFVLTALLGMIMV